MAEMPDVVTLTTISSNWGNDIRDRTIQRYSSVANRTSEHPTPAEGDLSYLEDSNTVWVYDGAAWVAGLGDGTIVTAKIADDAVTGDKLANDITAAFEVDGYTETSSAGLGATLANVSTVSLTIPAGWASWKCFASATFLSNLASGGFYEYRLTIDGTALQTLTPAGETAGGGNIIFPSAAVGRRTGMTTTGARTIALQAAALGGATVTLTDIALYARAVRLT